MTSINTNSSAMTALQSLQSINNDLETTQGRISTGYRVNDAQDNAAYWSIATTMRSDNNSLSAVSDSLGIGAATVDAAYTGLDSAKDMLDTIKAKLTSATSEGVDKSKVQDEITALQGQLKTIAESASFSGQNWLSNTDSTTEKSIVSSISRDSSGDLSVGSIKVDIADVRLFSNSNGILDKQINIDQFEAATGTSNIETSSVDVGTETISFSVTQGDQAARTVEIDADTLTAAGMSGTEIKSDADLKAVYKQALSDAGISGIDVDITAGAVSFTSLEDFTVGPATSTKADGSSGNTDVTDLGLGESGTDQPVDATATGQFSTSIQDINLNNLTAGSETEEISAYIKVVDEALSQVTTAASSLGAVQNRIDMQSEFVDKLMDTVDKGVGTLVDADMTEESTRLKALQTQQQLGVQALSIANNSSQSLMSLFR